MYEWAERTNVGHLLCNQNTKSRNHICQVLNVPTFIRIQRWVQQMGKRVFIYLFNGPLNTRFLYSRTTTEWTSEFIFFASLHQFLPFSKIIWKAFEICSLKILKNVKVKEFWKLPFSFLTHKKKILSLMFLKWCLNC